MFSCRNRNSSIAPDRVSIGVNTDVAAVFCSEPEPIIKGLVLNLNLPNSVALDVLETRLEPL